jgi:hypothetical protein
MWEIEAFLGLMAGLRVNDQKNTKSVLATEKIGRMRKLVFRRF